jgi:UDP-N-acetylglucosamine 2-epimerase (non-hydrolysing)
MIVIVTGTRAELIKCMPLMKEFERRKISHTFVHTGQHDIDDLLDEFELGRPDYTLYDPPQTSSRFMVKTRRAVFWGFLLMPKIRRLLNKIKPKCVLYQGDTLSTACTAVASSELLGEKIWKNAHVEAGLRSFDMFEPFPEEIARKICDRFSDILFAPSELSVKNLKREGLGGEIVKVGNTIVDSVDMAVKIARRRRLRRVGRGKYVVVNIHRHENIKSRERMRKIVEIVKCVSLPIYWPIHDNTRRQLEKMGFWKKLQAKGIHFLPLMSYVEFVWLLKDAKYLITDGGSIQEESLALKKPCLLLREKTERQEGLRTGVNFLTRLNVDYAKKIIERFESYEFKTPTFKNPYGDGRAAERIINYLVEKL